MLYHNNSRLERRVALERFRLDAAHRDALADRYEDDRKAWFDDIAARRISLLLEAMESDRGRAFRVSVPGLAGFALITGSWEEAIRRVGPALVRWTEAREHEARMERAFAHEA